MSDWITVCWERFVQLTVEGRLYATAHMSEEVKNASRYVPIAIAWGYFGNGILALIVIVGLILTLPSVPDALNDDSGFPFLYVL